jgi:hypothetical protein
MNAKRCKRLRRAWREAAGRGPTPAEWRAIKRGELAPPASRLPQILEPMEFRPPRVPGAARVPMPEAP